MVVKKILLGVIACFLLYWGGSILKCEILTALYGRQFEGLQQQTNMLGEAEYLKVLNHSDTEARIYYVGLDRSWGTTLRLRREEGKWLLSKWEEVVWSSSGSADECMWPYIR